MSYLYLFSPHNLALLNDWLQETGELYVDVYHPHTASGSTAFIVRSMNELKSMFSQDSWLEIEITIFRARQFPLRGIADETLLEQALQLIPDGQAYSIATLNLNQHPSRINFHGDGKSHEQFRRDFAEVLGEEVGIGREPSLIYDDKWILSHPSEVLYLSIHRNQNYYEPCSKNPEKYRWLTDLWQD